MSIFRFRWFETLPTVVSPIFDTALNIGDTIGNVFSKLQGLITVRNRRSVITSAVSGGASTTADVGINTLTIPANETQVGGVYIVRVFGIYTKPLSIGTTVNFWVKINGTKTLTLKYTPTGGQTNRPFELEAFVTVRSIGGAGTVYTAGEGSANSSARAVVGISSVGSIRTIDTTASWTIQAGFNFSNSNASNNVTANISIIRQD